jgi:hypothetical protein
MALDPGEDGAETEPQFLCILWGLASYVTLPCLQNATKVGKIGCFHQW